MTSPSSAADLARASELLRAGELVAFPTETVYGLGANALDPAAVGKIYEAKDRPATSPLIVHVDSIEMARGLAAEWPASAEALARAFWPGPLTLVVPKRPLIPDVVTSGLATVGLRMPAHPVALALIRACGLPLAGPSANRFTELSPTAARHVHQSLGDRVKMVLDGGPCTVGIESTVVALRVGEPPRLLRPGMISAAQLEAVTGEPLDSTAVPPLAPDAAHPSPGMHARHYSPRTPLFLASQSVVEPAAAAATNAQRIAHVSLNGMPPTPAAYAAALYATLHQLDSQGYDAIVVELPPDQPEWSAVRDRLLRAAVKVTG